MYKPSKEKLDKAIIPKLNSALFTPDNYSSDNSILLHEDKREIEFRGKRIEYKWNSRKKEHIPIVKKDWVIGKLLTNNRIITLTDEEVEAMPCFDMCDYQDPIDIETLGQYIGLKDRNGKKIFDGDILDVGNDYYGVIVEDYGSFKIRTFDIRDGYNKKDKPDYLDTYYIEQCEIIGNIYDNPELLKGE